MPAPDASAHDGTGHGCTEIFRVPCTCALHVRRAPTRNAEYFIYFIFIAYGAVRASRRGPCHDSPKVTAPGTGPCRLATSRKEHVRHMWPRRRAALGRRMFLDAQASMSALTGRVGGERARAAHPRHTHGTCRACKATSARSVLSKSARRASGPVELARHAFVPTSSTAPYSTQVAGDALLLHRASVRVSTRYDTGIAISDRALAARETRCDGRGPSGATPLLRAA